MVKAIWNGKVIAESNHTEKVEGNHYFPPNTIKREFLEESPTRTNCPWKGDASYYHVVVDGQRNADAAWFYPTPSDAAKNIQNHIAFWRGVQIEEEG